jgi:hypothetical protein
MSQTSCLDCYMSWRMPVCGLPNFTVLVNSPTYELPFSVYMMERTQRNVMLEITLFTFLANDCNKQQHALGTEHHKQAHIWINHVCVIRAMNMMTKLITIVMLHKALTRNDRVQCNIRTREQNAELKRHASGVTTSIAKTLHRGAGLVLENKQSCMTVWNIASTFKILWFIPYA